MKKIFFYISLFFVFFSVSYTSIFATTVDVSGTSYIWKLRENSDTPSNTKILNKKANNDVINFVNGLITGPCKPPYMCDFSVIDTNQDGTKDSILIFSHLPTIPKTTQENKTDSTNNAKSQELIITKEVKDVGEITVWQIITGPCKPPYMCDFVWEVQAISATWENLGDPQTGKFKVSVTMTNSVGTSQAVTGGRREITPTRIAQKIDLNDLVTFRWTPLVPKPKDPVTYRLKVWQLMQGQNGTQSMKTTSSDKPATWNNNNGSENIKIIPKVKLVPKTESTGTSSGSTEVPTKTIPKYFY